MCPTTADLLPAEAHDPRAHRPAYRAHYHRLQALPEARSRPAIASAVRRVPSVADVTTVTRAERPAAPVTDAESRGGQPALVGRRRRRLPGRARRVPGRRRLRLVPGGAARGRRPAARRRARPAGARGRLRRRGRRPLAGRARAPRWSAIDLSAGMLRHARRGRRHDPGYACRWSRPTRWRCRSRDGSVRHRLHRVRRGAVRGRLRRGDARGVPGAAPRRPVGVLGHPPDALDLPRRPGRGRPGRRALLLRPPPVRRARRRPATPTYVEQHRTLGDRIRELVGGRLRAARPRRAGVAGRATSGSGASGARCAAGSSPARRSSWRSSPARLRPPETRSCS